jgi:hypothetical protein
MDNTHPTAPPPAIKTGTSLNLAILRLLKQRLALPCIRCVTRIMRMLVFNMDRDPEFLTETHRLVNFFLGAPGVRVRSS